MTALINESSTSSSGFEPKYRNLVNQGSDPVLWERITHQLAQDPSIKDLGSGKPQHIEHRILDLVVAFLVCCGRIGDSKLPRAQCIGEGPTVLALPPAPDEGWHWFQLHSKEYREFCHTNFGRIIEHKPYNPVYDAEKMGSLANGRARTLALMDELSLTPIDHIAWHFPMQYDKSGKCDDACSYWMPEHKEGTQHYA